MFCNNCGKQIPEVSKFCQYCGSQIVTLNEDSKSSEKSYDEKENEDIMTKSKADLLWDKFVEIYDAKDEARKTFNSLSSPYVWQLIERLGLNAFEEFIQENREELNKQPYKLIEALKNVYIWSVSGGYKLWLAQGLTDDKEELNKFKSFNLDKFIEAWKVYDFDKAYKAISDDMRACIIKYNDFRFGSLLEAVPEIKDLSNATVEKLKSSLIRQILSGYYSGQIENSFRK